MEEIIKRHLTDHRVIWFMAKITAQPFPGVLSDSINKLACATNNNDSVSLWVFHVSDCIVNCNEEETDF